MTTPPHAAAFDEFERSGWSGRSGRYEAGYAALTAALAEPLLDAARVQPGSSVLDVGTGSGNVAAAAARRGARVTGVDPDPGMVAAAGLRVPEAAMALAALPLLPFADAAFDAVVASFVINHTGDPPRAAAELLRVLRPGGLVAASAWRYPQMRANAVFTEAFDRAGAVRPATLPEPPFRAHADRCGFAALLRDAGFEAVQVTNLDWVHLVDPDRWWTAVVEGTPKDAALLAAQDRATAARIHSAYHHLVAPFVREDGLAALPASAHIATGRRPAVS